MNLIILEGASQGLLWFRTYYMNQSQLAGAAAFTAFDKAIDTILAQPFSGYRHLDYNDIFVKRILRTSFSILYTIRGETVFVIDLHDQRGLRSAEAIRTHKDEIRRKYARD